MIQSRPFSFNQAASRLANCTLLRSAKRKWELPFYLFTGEPPNTSLMCIVPFLADKTKKGKHFGKS